MHPVTITAVCQELLQGLQQLAGREDHSIGVAVAAFVRTADAVTASCTLHTTGGLRSADLSCHLAGLRVPPGPCAPSDYPLDELAASNPMGLAPPLPPPGFRLSGWQERHALLVLARVDALQGLRFALCPKCVGAAGRGAAGAARPYCRGQQLGEGALTERSNNAGGGGWSPGRASAKGRQGEGET